MTPISVLLPSRGRPESLRHSIETLRTHAADEGRLDILVVADPDDDETIRAAAGLAVRVFLAPERFGYSRLHLYYNLLAEHAVGEWMQLWNDDASMTTHGWDDTLVNLPAGVLVAWLDSNHPRSLCCFPAVRRAAVAAVGGFSPHTPHCDTYWHQVGAEAGAIERVDIRVFHDRDDLTGGHQDQTRAEGKAQYQGREFFGSRVQTAIHRDAARLKGLVR